MIRLLGDGYEAGSGYAQRVKQSKEAKTKSITQQQNRHPCLPAGRFTLAIKQIPYFLRNSI